MSLKEAANAVGIHYRTARNWVGWYRTGGLREVVSHKRGGKGGQSRLSEEQVSRLSWEMARGRLRTAEDVRNWIAYHYGVKYEMPGIYSLMKRARATGAALPSWQHREENSWWRRISARVLRLFFQVKDKLTHRLPFRNK